MFTKLLAITKNTFTETIRQPVFGLLVLIIMACLTINTSIASFSTSPSDEIYDDDKLLYDLGLSTMLIGGLFLAGFSSAGVLSREIENKTVLTVISKPVSRPLFVIGKFIGLAGAITAGFFLCAITFFLSARHGVMQANYHHMDWVVLLFGLGAFVLTFGIATFCNYFYGWHFSSTCLAIGTILMTLACIPVCFLDRDWNTQSFAKETIEAQLPTAVILVYFAVIILTALAVAASTRLGQVMTLLVCFVVLGLGLTSDYFFQPYAFPDYKPFASTQPSAADDPMLEKARSPDSATLSENPAAESPDETGQEPEPAATATELTAARAGKKTAQTLARIVYAVIPNMQFFWVSDAIILRRPIPGSFVLRVLGYAVFYIIALVLLAVALFQTREVAAEETASSAPPIVHLLGVVGRLAAALMVAAGIWWTLTTAVKPGDWSYRGNAVIIALGIFSWFFWGWFARGMKWTWFMAIALVGILPLGGMGYVLVTQPGAFHPSFAMPGVAAILVLTILSRSSRAYFGFGGKPRRRRAAKAMPNAG